ncbi:MAG: hypothetical protein N2688_11465, partial [Burkholderiaceae bacterium]|nr:hypothetical protein [Burkholderiaceae bacterium]
DRLERLSGGANNETWSFDALAPDGPVPLILRRKAGDGSVAEDGPLASLAPEHEAALLRAVAVAATGTAVLSYQGQTIDLSRPFERLTIVEALRRYAPQYGEAQLADRDFLHAELARLGSTHAQEAGLGALQLALFEETVEAKLVQPTYIVDYPVEVSPLARASDTRPEITERFELYIAGRETANGFSELNDPEDQAARFQQQVRARQAGDEEAMYYDADYVRALEYGMPPAAGCGVGVDRFVMLLTDAPSIRDVLLFPHLRPEERA